MSATVREFIEAMEYPSPALQRVLPEGALSLRRSADGVAAHCRTDFVEAELQGGGFRCLVSLPKSREALMRASHIATRLKQLPEAICGRYEVVERGLCHRDAAGAVRTEELVVELLPRGEFLDCVMEIGGQTPALAAALRRLQEQMARFGVRHNNLKGENLYLTHRGEVLLVRPHRMSFEGASDEERSALEALEAAYGEYDLVDMEPSTPREVAAEGVIAVGVMSDERIRIWRDGLYGYADCEGEVVIEPQFVGAGDFREGRAEVQTKSGWGVIDKWGRWIVEARYDGVDYNDMEGTIRLRIGKEWALADYSGRLLCGSQKEHTPK